MSPQKWHFEDEFPFPKVGYVNSLEGIFSHSFWAQYLSYSCCLVFFTFPVGQGEEYLGVTGIDVHRGFGRPVSLVTWRGFIWELFFKCLPSANLGGGFKHFLCSHLYGEDSHFDEHIFQRGWNHQLVMVNCWFVLVVWDSRDSPE